MKKIFLLSVLLLVSFKLNAQIASFQSGAWSTTSTWVGNLVPTSANDVIIDIGHTVTIDDANAACNNLSFTDATAHLAMGLSSSILSVYGNITLAPLVGSGATATAVLTGDVVSAINVDNGGSAYLAVVLAFTGGGGTGLTANATVVGGVITGITVTNGGSGYTTAPTVNIFPTHTIFTAWPAGAKIKFTGSANQTLSGWSTAAFTTSFDEIIIDKSAGKVFTGTPNMRFQIGKSMEIINGTFELSSTDDIEGRSYSGSASSPTITIQAGATFNMVGGSSHIRRFSNLTEEASKIGKMIVFGTATLGSSSSNRINFGGIDIENGGVVEMASGRSTGASTFNPGVITVKSGGTFKNSLSTTNFWYNNLTIPPAVIINSGGEYEVAATSTTLPQGGITQNNGSSFRYSSSGVTSMHSGIPSYKTLILSGAGSKSLGVNTSIEEALQLSGTFTTLSLNGFTLTYNTAARLRYGASGQATAQTTKDTEWPASGGPQNVQIYNTGGVTLHDNRSIPGTLTLTLGQFDNNGSADDKVITMGDGATISRARGSLSSAPTFGSTVNLSYTGTIENVTTGFEMPSSNLVLNNLSVTSSQGITLGANITVNGTLSFGSSASSITTNTNTLTLASSASMTGETAGRYVVGNLFTTQNVGTGPSTFGGIGVTLNAGTDNLGNVSITRISGSNGIVTANSNQSIARKWTITSDSPPINGRDLTLSWLSSDDNGKTFSGTNNAIAFRYNGSSWIGVGSLVDVSGSDPRSITVNTTSFSDWTVSDENAPLHVEALNLTALIQGFYNDPGTGYALVPDTVTVELRKGSAPYGIEDQAKVILNPSGNASPKFYTVLDGTSYYIVIKHRNAMETWSAAAQSFTAGTMSYDFTTAQNKAFGNNTKQINGKWCFYVGDINQDGFIETEDLNGVYNDNVAGVEGPYVITDLNFDTFVETEDLNLVFDNNVAGVEVKRPLDYPLSSIETAKKEMVEQTMMRTKKIIDQQRTNKNN